MSGRKAAGTSKAFAIDVDDWEDAGPASSTKPAKNASQPPAQRTEIDLVNVSDDDEIVIEGHRWVGKPPKAKGSKGKAPQPNPKPVNEKKQKKKKNSKKQSRAATTRAGSDKHRAQEDSDYEETPRKRPTRARAKAKASQPETYTVSSDSSSEHDEPPPIVEPPKRPAGSTSTATSQSSNALITSYFDKEKQADNHSMPPKRGDRPPPTKRLRLSRPGGTPAPAPSSSRSATAVSPTSHKRIPSPEVVIAPRFPAAAVHGSNDSGTSASASAPRPSASPRKTTEIPSQASTSTPQLTVAASTPNEITKGVKPPAVAVPQTSAPAKLVVGSSKDMPMQISDSEPEPERTPSPELPALNEEWIYDLEATDPAPPPALLRWRSESASLSGRSPSPQIGPLQDECIYSLEGLHIHAEREDTPDGSDSEQQHDVDMALDQRCPPTHGARSGARLRRVHTGPGLLHARLMAQDASLYPSARIDAVKRLRAVGRSGPSLRTTAHNRKGVAYDFPPRTAHAFAASGAVNDVVQKNGWIAAGCSTSCIVHDTVAATDDEPLPGPDNNQHTLAVFSPSRNRWDGYDAHNRSVSLPPERRRQHVVASARHYTVEGVAWDPTHPSRLVSCGADGMVALWQPTANGHMGIVRRWDLSSRSDERRADTKYEYESGSPDVAFPPHDAPLFAVGPSKTGQIYLHYGPLDGDGDSIIIELRRSRAPWGPLQWGHSASHRALFAGISGAYDIEIGQELYMFPDIRDGQNIGVDATDLDPTFGKMLAVVTNKGRRTARRLRLYDVNESAAKHITTVELDIDTRANRQVTALSFSPDGVLLALGHEDNSVYVYDSRFLPKPGERTQQALCRFVHGESAVPEEESFGVTCIAWAPTRGPLACGAGEDGLYAGGADGHVRLWRTGLSATSCHNGAIVASMCAGIGSLSLGDIFAGEKMLVVGDNNGKLAVWDRPAAPL